MRVLAFVFSIFCILFIFSSCAYKQDQLLFEQKAADTSIHAAMPSANSYHIKSQDILQIRNLQNMSYIVDKVPTDGGGSSGGGGGSSSSGSEGQSYQVEEDGSVGLPVIGHVQVGGLTRLEATNKIEDLYRKTLLKDPIIDLRITNLKVTLLGEIKGQGNYPLVKDQTTLIDIIGQAGGFTDRADTKTVEIIRGSQSNPIITRVDFSNIKSLSDPATILRSGDIVYVAQNKRSIRNDNIQNFSTLIQPALIVLNTALLILTLSRR